MTQNEVAADRRQQLNIRVSPALLTRLQRAAELEDEPQSAVVRRALRAELRAIERRARASSE